MFEATEYDELTGKVINAAIRVHQELGPGLLESVYQKCLVRELREAGLCVEEEVPVPVFYRGQLVQEISFRMDVLVEDTLVVEVKSTASVIEVFKKTTNTYVRLAKKPVGLLINFNVVLLKDGITRVLNTRGSTGPV